MTCEIAAEGRIDFDLATFELSEFCGHGVETGLKCGSFLSQLRRTEKEMEIALLLVGVIQLMPDRCAVDICAGDTTGTVCFKRPSGRCHKV